MNKNFSNLSEILENSYIHYTNHIALAIIDGIQLTYAQLFHQSQTVSYWLSRQAIRREEKVAILSENSPNWVVAYWGIVGLGAIAVPLLPDFSKQEIENILHHSDSRLLFISRRLFKRHENQLDFDGKIVFLDDWNDENGESIFEYAQKTQFESFTPECAIIPEDIAVIIYTSGTTGHPKGVMLTHGALIFETDKVMLVQDVNDTDRFLSFLPLSHVYENVLGMIIPIRQGASITYMQKPPTPTLLLSAMKSVRPTMVLTVPLIIEKIYNNKIVPELTKNKILKGIIHIWPIRHILNNYAGKKLKAEFGGSLRFFGIGGASLNPRTERFLRDAKFPYSCGFGLTETSSLIFGSKPGKTKFQSVGKPLDTLMYRVIRPDANTRVGEVIVKWGGNMKGYYKEPDMTASVLTEGNWFHTGDLAEMTNGNLYLKGRSKTMILGPSGENIYPEEIESVLNRMEGVIESLVVEVKGKIVAKVYLNTEELSRKYAFFKDAASYHSAEVHHKISHYLSELQQKLNENLNKFSQVSKVELVTRPFEKTATHKIKRIQNPK